MMIRVTPRFSSTLAIQKSLKKIYSGNKDAAKAFGAEIAKNFLKNQFLQWS
ncbi:MAG: hypothetical protein CM1200mP30_05940 [Pseudomonadota bacterium]|nr:MAG: hypothetical protein CM1200mP30_05940 [Pseudomonadota bacterium]